MPGTVQQELLRILKRMREQGRTSVWLSPHNVEALNGRPAQAFLRQVAPVPNTIPAAVQMPQSAAGMQPPAVNITAVHKNPPANTPAEIPPPSSPVNIAAPEGWKETVSGCGWAELEQLAASCKSCSLCRNASRRIFSAGVSKPAVLFVGDYPSAETWANGEPFAGKSGEMLKKMGIAMGLTWEENTNQPGAAYVNLLKCRPAAMPDNTQTGACLPILLRQIELMKPDYMVLLGALPLKLLCGKESFSAEKGKWQNIGGIPAVTIQNPVQIMRQEANKERFREERRFAWNTLQEVAARLNQK